MVDKRKYSDDEAEEGELVDKNARRERHRQRSRSPREQRRRRTEMHRDYSPLRENGRRQMSAVHVSDLPQFIPQKEEDDATFEIRVEAALAATASDQEDQDARIVDERRKRRQAIVQKYNNQEAHAIVHEVQETRERHSDGRAVDTSAVDDNQGDGHAEPAEPVPYDASGTGEVENQELDDRIAVHNATLARRSPSTDVDDIFAATPTDARPSGLALPSAGRKGLTDSYDDAEGYYNFQVGEILGDRYEVFATHGRGVFSSVLRARDVQSGMKSSLSKEVAVKVIRANDTMYKAGQMEKILLKKLSEADPEGKKHVIRMLGNFVYRQHLCLVFEPMDMNLRELTKRYGRGIGLSVAAVRVYSQQLLVALHHLMACGVIHADIKPDNILVNDKRTAVKICDFGSAMFAGDNAITPYLVSRFYRAPEIILGLPYDHPLDIWSIGCVIYELLTGKILFPGKTNNEMLKLMMDLKGPFPKKMLKKAEFGFKHFETDPNLSFALVEDDPVTKQPIRRLISNPAIKKDFSALLAGQAPDKKKLSQLADLLERMTALDPEKRIQPGDALHHPFIAEPM